MEVTAALALCRFTRDAAALLVFGGSVYIAVLVPPPLRPHLAGPYARPRRAAALLIGVVTLASLPIEAASIGGGWPAALDPETIAALLFDTTIGLAWMAQAVLSVLLLVVLRLPFRDAAAAVTAAALLASTSMTGHAAMHEGWLAGVQRVNAAMHLIAVGFWVGALVPLLPTLSALRQPAYRRHAAEALRRFSVVGHGAVAVVIASGALNAILILGRWPLDPASPYLRFLTLKIVVVGFMTGLALLNRYGYVPRLGMDEPGNIARIRRATLVEVVLGLGAVALVAWFGLLDPV